MIDFVHRNGRQQDSEDVDAGHSINHAVVNLGDDGKPTISETIHHPHLPQRAETVEFLREDLPGEPLQVGLVAFFSQSGSTDVKVDVEELIVHPDRVILEGNPIQDLAVAGYEVQL